MGIHIKDNCLNITRQAILRRRSASRRSQPFACPTTVLPRETQRTYRRATTSRRPRPSHQVKKDVIYPPMSVAVEVYFRKEHPSDPPKTWVLTKVMHEWMKQLNILHIVVNTTVTLAEQGSGSFSLEYKDKATPVPTFTAGSTGAHASRGSRRWKLSWTRSACRRR